MRALAVLFLFVASTSALSPLLPSVTWIKPNSLSSGSSNEAVKVVSCADGVCSLPSSNESLHEKVLNDWKSADEIADAEEQITSVLPIVESESNKIAHIATLADMGWTSEEASRALDLHNNDVTKAAEYLEAQDEETDLRMGRLKELVAKGWQEQAAFAALEKNEGNKTAAEAFLSQEEERVQRHFMVAVKDMVANGWSEYVAREALLSQYLMDVRRAKGENITVSDEILQSIQPTLRSPNVTTNASANTTDLKQDAAATTTPSEKKEKPPKAESSTTESPPPTPAKVEEVVFEVNAANFQQLVLESPVPVVLDVYADWCGPCKQLGPVLEQAAVKAGGLFRVAKVNADTEKGLSEALGVQGLPTVYTVDKGKLNDRFVGMLPRDQLQTYLVRAVTGQGARVQEKDFSAQDLAAAESKVITMAGLAALTFKRKEQLNTEVELALELHGAFEGGTNAVLSQGVKAALQRLIAARGDIRNATLGTIDTTTASFKEKIFSNIAAVRLLEVAGFKIGTAPGTSHQLILSHSNPAVLTLVMQKVEEVARDKRFAKMRSTQTFTPPSRHTRPAAVATPTVPPGQTESLEGSALPITASVAVKRGGVRSAETVAQSLPAAATTRKTSTTAQPKSAELITVALRRTTKTGIKSASLKLGKRATLRDAVTQLLDQSTVGGESEVLDASLIEVMFPLPRRRLTKSSAELDRPLDELSGGSGGAISLAYHLSTATEKPTKTGVLSRLNPLRSSLMGTRTTATVSAHVSTGIAPVTVPPTTPVVTVTTTPSGTDEAAAPEKVKRNHKSTKSTKKTGKTSKTNTLFSTGILAQSAKKNNEYFGGDSTVVSAGKEDEDEEPKK